MEWLDAQPHRSVVYVSYGSMLRYGMVWYGRQQVEGMLGGLRECGRSYLVGGARAGLDEEVEFCLVDNGVSEQASKGWSWSGATN
ncbi:hypothetical protein C2845_PM05G05830 [Panicum miliaceum]|uniref:Uncharacterized protein n=1 Tax=Panicum miliaceum TaxID=4540 RepID=A0A3L6T2M6_PANMI|nr:hypothetical protein C2845_PM05G05830 [Panicum miliaceum]